ncbi:penicillin-binding protein 2 [Carnobacteriaceae bacterium zg-ZUI240]|nr:penicillin-binding protein 2 [Carnobacteriaceae bacterium zg-ZUI240]
MIKKRRKSHIPLRLNILFSVVVILFGALVYRLVDLQFNQKTKYDTVLSQTSAIRVKSDATRGQIFDKNGVLLVGNESYKTIDYTRFQTKTEDMVTLAKQVANLIDVPIDQVTPEQLKIYFIATHSDEISRRVGETKLTGADLVQAQMNTVTDTEIAYDNFEKEVAAIYNQMNAVSYLGTISLKSRGVTDTEIAAVTEGLDANSGISVGSDWERVYPQGDLLRSLLGNVSSQKAGLPSEQLDQLLAQGYQQNSRVGTSYLEQQYDSVLRGTPKVTSTVLNADSQVVSTNVDYEGKAGDNIYLTIDSELQKKLDNILTNYLATTPDDDELVNDGVYAVVQEVKTGAILAISGKRFAYKADTDRYDRSHIEDNTLGTFLSNYTMGSVVKPATVISGYQNGAISVDNNVLVDAPITFDNGKTTISSLFNRTGRVSLTDEMALTQSSNVYMVKLAMRLGGQEYREGDRLNIDMDAQTKLRKTFASFGLGAYTGIDLPYENKGYAPDTFSPSEILMNSFGQFDNFTTLQLSQYMNTLGNGGFRFAPRLVDSIRTVADIQNPNGQLVTDMTPKLLNQVEITKEQLQRVYNGLYGVTHVYFLPFNNYRISVLGKTGTAETFYNGQLQRAKGMPVNTTTFASFAPQDNPEISVTVVVPNLLDKQVIPMNAHRVAYSIYQAYYGE